MDFLFAVVFSMSLNFVLVGTSVFGATVLSNGGGADSISGSFSSCKWKFINFMADLTRVKVDLT